MFPHSPPKHEILTDTDFYCLNNWGRIEILPSWIFPYLPWQGSPLIQVLFFSSFIVSSFADHLFSLFLWLFKFCCSCEQDIFLTHFLTGCWWCLRKLLTCISSNLLNYFVNSKRFGSFVLWLGTITSSVYG